MPIARDDTSEEAQALRTGTPRSLCTGEREPLGDRPWSGARAVLRRCARHEGGSVSLEYLIVALTCGLLAAGALLAAAGPGLVSMWSWRRACLYDDTCAARSWSASRARAGTSTSPLNPPEHGAP